MSLLFFSYGFYINICHWITSPLPLITVAVIKASELWAAMEPEILVTVRMLLEPTNEAEEEQQEDAEEEKAEEDEMATAVKIAQYLRVNKYRWS